jgi:hypothetical protein
MAVRPARGKAQPVTGREGSGAVDVTRRAAMQWRAGWQAQAVSRGGRWLVAVLSSKMTARAGWINGGRVVELLGEVLSRAGACSV